MKPFSQASENNQGPILEVLRAHFGADVRRVLEIGSGTGQHAVCFGAAFPRIIWQTSDLPGQHAGILAWLGEARLANVRSPLVLDVEEEPWPLPDGSLDAAFSANTAHIMSWRQVERMVAGVGRLLVPGGLFLLYGPFNYGGHYTSASNEDFDAMLRRRDPASGLRDVEALDRLAESAGLVRSADHAMPANNRTLVWRK